MVRINMSFAEEKIILEGLTFDDVLLVPAFSEVVPGQVSLKSRFSRNISLDIPIVSAAMDTVTEAPMARALAREGGIGVIHKNLSVQAQAAQVAEVHKEGLRVAAAVGIGAGALERVEALAAAGADAVVLDCAHGHSLNVVTLLRKIKQNFNGFDVVVGNIATADAAKCLIDNGADSIKVGIGPGSICTTRVVAGVGVPQLSAIYECVKAAEGSGVTVIGDGGLRYSGDAVKALAAGADCLMFGSMFAGTEEAPGEKFVDGGILYKVFRGMGSLDAMKAGSSDRYFQEGANKLVPEGIVGKVAYKGPVADVIFQLIGGIRAGMGYCGAPDLLALKQAKFVRITSSGMIESHPHDVKITKEAPNYK